MNRTMAVAFLVLAFIFQIATMALPPVTQVWPTENNPATYGYYYQSTSWIAVNPFDQDIFYVYAEGKLLKSVNGGQNWIEIGQGLPDRAVFSDTMVYPCPLAFSPFDETGDTFIIGTERLGVSGAPYMTEDGGETFFPINICEKGPGHSNLNFRFGSSTWGAFSNEDSNYLFLSGLGEVGGQPVFIGDYDDQTNSMAILQNSMFPALTGSCPSTGLSVTCLNSNNPGCWQYGDDPCYWGGELRLTVLPNSNDYFETEVVHTDSDYSAGYRRTQYKMYDSADERHCLVDNVFFDMDYFGSPYPDSERYWHINAPVFYSGENTTFYTVIPQVLKYSACPVGNPPVGDMERIYFDDEYETSPLLAKCDGLDGNGDWIFTAMDNGELPHSCSGNLRWIRKSGNYLFISTGNSDEFLAYDMVSESWVTFTNIKMDHFELIDLENNQVGILYMKRYAGAGGIFHTELRLLTFNPSTCQYSDTLKEDFTGTFTGLSEYHVFSGNSTPWRDTSNHKNIIVSDDDMAAYFSGNEFKILTRQNNEWSTLSTSYLENFYYSSSCDLCTANFTSMAVKNVGESDKWGYMSSDAGIWRNKEIGTEDDDGTVIVPAFEHISGGYNTGLPNPIPNTDFGNYAYKVVLGPIVEDEQTLYTATKSGLWKGYEETGGGDVDWINIFDPTDHNETKTEVYDVLIGEGCVFAVSEGGIWRSPDDSTWTKIYDVSISGGPVSALAKYADCASRIVCAGGSYIYASSDSGTNWYEIADVTSTQAPIKKIECVEEDGLYQVYSLTNDGILNKTVASGDSVCSTLSFTVDSALPCDVDLSWTDDQNASSYDIFRAAEGVPWETIASSIETTSYQDSTAIGGKAYYYAIMVNYSDPCDSYMCATNEVSVPGDFSVSSVSPTTGSWAGGTSVKLSGTGLDCSCNVYFGDNLATNCSTDVDGIWVTSPTSSICLNPHTVPIKVTDSCNEITAGVGFEYYWNMAISPSTLAGGTLGTQYSQQQITTSGGVAPYSYSVKSGLLPSGITLLSTGYLKGVPSTVGEHAFTITSTDSCGITEDKEYMIEIEAGNSSQLLAWGSNGYGQFGNNTTTSSNIPIDVSSLADFTTMAGGANHTLGLKSDGTLWAWGRNNAGQLGNGQTDTSAHSQPIQVNLSNVLIMSCSTNASDVDFSVVVKSDGTVWNWGASSEMLGRACPTNCATPGQVSGVTSINKIDAGGGHTLALKSDGTVYAWGDNSAGQLGNGTIINPNPPAPVQVMAAANDPLEDVTTISAGEGHSLALKTDGTVWIWGCDGGFGGSGCNSYHSYPVQVMVSENNSLNGIIQIGTGWDYSIALKYDGTVWNRTNGNAYASQVMVSQNNALSGIIAISDGTAHCLALKNDGTLWAWGANSSGQLGIGNTTDSIYAVQVSGSIASVSDVFAGGYHNFARLSFISPDTLSDGSVGCPYSQTISATFGTSSYTYSVTDGSLPSGLSLSPTTGILSGTPTTNGTCEFTVTATTVVNSKSYSVEKEYSLVVDTCSGSMYSAWGSNGYGVYGDGTTTNSSRPVSVSNMACMDGVAGGHNHSLGLGSDGNVWSWGRNSEGELGNGTYTDSTSPGIVPGISDVVAVSAGDYYSAVLKSNGTVWTWGDGAAGVLGNGTWNTSNTPVQVSNLSNIVSVDAGGWHVLALKGNHTLWTWGANDAGQLGDGGTSNSSTPLQVKTDSSNYLQNVDAISAGEGHSVVLKTDGTVWAWGCNGGYDLNGCVSYSIYPSQVMIDQNTPPTPLASITNIAAGYDHSLARKNDGTVWAWGVNNYGQLGNGTNNNSSVAVQVLTAPATYLTNVVAVAAGYEYSLALKGDGTVWAWGYNLEGELGIGNTTSSNYAVQVTNLSNVDEIFSGTWHSFAKYGSVSTNYAWGDNESGQLGNGNTTNTNSPAEVSNISCFPSIAGGYNHSLGLTAGGTVWAWGRNLEGEFGNGSTTSSNAPVPVNDIYNITGVSAGGYHSLALKSDGSVWAWGDNGVGQLGDGTTTGRTEPVTVSNLTGVTAIDAGGWNSIALKSDGTVRAWGDNSAGQIGDGTTNNSNVAVQVMASQNNPLTNVADVSFGEGQALAVKSDGTVWAWGWNDYGQLGDGSTTSSSYPVQVKVSSNSYLTNADSVSAGYYHSIALKTDGTVWMWGNGTNYAVQVMTGSTTPLTGIVAISAGNEYSLAFKNDGTVWAWGDNTYGQLGQGDNASYSYAVPIDNVEDATGIAAGGWHGFALKGN